MRKRADYRLSFYVRKTEGKCGRKISKKIKKGVDKRFLL